MIGFFQDLSWSQIMLKSLVFFLSSMLQVRFVDAATPFIIPAEKPKDCVQAQSQPCVISTGDQPRLFQWNEAQFELDRYLLLQTEKKGSWSLFNGMMVLKNRHTDPVKIHTPFADVFVGKSKIMIHVIENKVRVLSLAGEGIRVVGRANGEEHFLLPGFQNWYGGAHPKLPVNGVVSVIEFEQFAQQRSAFFMDFRLGFIEELRRVAGAIKWAAKIASQINRDLVKRKVASLEEKHQGKIRKAQRHIDFNKYLRKLFLKKIRYDD